MCTFIGDEDTHAFIRQKYVGFEKSYLYASNGSNVLLLLNARGYGVHVHTIQRDRAEIIQDCRSHWQPIKSHELKRIFLICVDYVNEAVRRRIKAVHIVERAFSVEI